MPNPWESSWIKRLFVVVIVSFPVSVGIAQRASKIDSNALKNSGKTGGEWLTYGLNYAETRYSPLKQINATNINRLALAWWFDIPGPPAAHQATPLMANGVLYSITKSSMTFAVDARTGKEKWRYDPRVTDNEPHSPRGVAIYEDKIFAPILDGRLVALNAAMGTVAWSVQTTPPGENYYITIAPRIVNGKVIIGNSGGEAPVRGFVSAYDAHSGALIWRFFTVPGDPAKGFENGAMKKAAASWSGEWYKFGGGGTVWDSISFDPDLNLVYFGTGNAGPWAEELRQSKGLDNLYVASIVALNADTGVYKWHYQFTPGDSWDYDGVQQLTLADLKIDKRSRKVIMQANKNGFFYVIDRQNGQLISAQPYARLNWATGVDPKTGRPLVHVEARYGLSPVCILPGKEGAHNSPPMSFNSATGLVYVPIKDPTGEVFALDPNFTYTPGNFNTGVVRPPDIACPPAPSAVPNNMLPAIGPIRTPPQSQRGANWLIAWDPVHQRERWSDFGGRFNEAGSLTTAANLVFRSAGDSHLAAHRADTGEKLWNMAIPNGGVTGPPITFMLEGKQYVVVSGLSQTGTNAAGGVSVFRPRLFAFVLDGKASWPTLAPEKE